MPYNFSNLSPADFEDLTRDLLGEELGIRFEAFAPGPDDGIDGRHAKNGRTILQAKHYVGSTYRSLKSAMKRERRAIDRIAPKRYILATARPLTPANKDELANIIGSSLKSPSDIFTPRDLNGLLRKYPDLLKSHLKLWLSDAAVLETIVHAAAESFNKITRDEIQAKVKIYAINPSFYEANATLSSQHIVIISGPPGVGKSTLAEMLAFTHIRDDWDLVAIRNLDDGFAKINDTRKQVFFFDDFLGKIALDKHALAHTDSDIARFIRRIGKSPNARFILTTRAYIFEEARRISEHLADKRLDITKYLLDVGKYTRRIKARILYNHLLVAGTPSAHVTTLIASDALPKIVDHPHYNPRIIEFMTDAVHLTTVEPRDYPAAFLEALAHPDMIWNIAFRTHISKPCQHLLLCLFFLNEWSASITELRQAYEALHPCLSKRYGDSHNPKDFEEALKILEGGFLSISGTRVGFVNPSLRDYLDRYLNDAGLLAKFASTTCDTTWARSVWRHAVKLKFAEEQLRLIASSFESFVPRLLTLPIFIRRKERHTTHLQPTEISNTNRIELLLEWFEITQNMAFWNAALSLASAPAERFDSWRDGTELVELLAHVRDGSYYDNLPDQETLSQLLERGIVAMIHEGMSPDEIEGIADVIEENRRLVGNSVVETIHIAIVREIDSIEDTVRGFDSESSLEEYGKALERLGSNLGVPKHKLNQISECVGHRKFELEEMTANSSSPSIGRPSAKETDSFDDLALRGLFASLARL